MNTQYNTHDTGGIIFGTAPLLLAGHERPSPDNGRTRYEPVPIMAGPHNGPVPIAV